MSTAIASSVAPSLSVRTVAIEHPGALLSILPSDGALSWVRRGEGLVAWGEAARMEFGGAERFSRAQRWWTSLVRDAEIDDSVNLPGSGAVAFASFAFDPEPGHSVVVVPRVVVGLRDGVAWLTQISLSSLPSSTNPLSTSSLIGSVDERADSELQVTFSEGTRTVESWKQAVETAVERITLGGIDKVVLARDLTVTSDEPIDSRILLERLASEYPECWTFAVDGLVGATPELLVRRTGDRVTSRVLAGTIRASEDSGKDARLAQMLLASNKDHEEHKYAVGSVAAALAAHCTDLDVPERPRLLRLSNVQHLATDVTGELVDGAPVLALAASLHPTAAVCGTPTERAFALIRELEGMDRGRYAGPVGWLDSNGDGEFGIALRCAQIDADDPTQMRLFAGCGIVAGSTAESELAESDAKFEAMRGALR
jgi:menaquinone-specific isochorismate synthase